MLRFFWPHKTLDRLLEEIDEEIEANAANPDQLANLWGIRRWALQSLPVEGITVTIMINTEEPEVEQPPDVVNVPFAELSPEDQRRVN